MTQKHLLSAFIALAFCLSVVAGHAQDVRPTIAVPIFKGTTASQQKYAAAVTQKVTEMLKKSKRFIVVSRSAEEVEKEREFQKSEEFLDRQLAAENAQQVKDIVDQDSQIEKLYESTDQQSNVVFIGADYVLQGEIRKVDVSRILNADNTVRGYKALVAIQISVTTTLTNTIGEAKGFNSLPLKIPMFSPERSVDDAIVTLEPALEEYFKDVFPVVCNIVRVLPKGVIVNAGLKQGLKTGDKLSVAVVEQIGGQKVEIPIGEIKVTALSGDSFAQCTVSKGDKDINARFAAAQTLRCTLIKKK